MCYLIQWSFREKKYINWKTDSGMDSLLRWTLDAAVLKRAKDMEIGGLRDAVGHIKAAFLKEAVRVMSGSQHMADSLSDLQATLLHEKQRLTEDHPERAELT